MDQEEQNQKTLHRQLVKKNTCLFCMVNFKREKKFGNKNGLKEHNLKTHRRMITCGTCEQAFATVADKKIHNDIMNHRGTIICLILISKKKWPVGF